MGFLLWLVAWSFLFVLAWPIALAALAVAPVIWLLALPLRLVGLCISALFALLSTILFLPARLLGYRRNVA